MNRNLFIAATLTLVLAGCSDSLPSRLGDAPGSRQASTDLNHWNGGEIQLEEPFEGLKAVDFGRDRSPSSTDAGNYTAAVDLPGTSGSTA